MHLDDVGLIRDMGKLPQSRALFRGLSWAHMAHQLKLHHSDRPVTLSVLSFRAKLCLGTFTAGRFPGIQACVCKHEITQKNGFFHHRFNFVAFFPPQDSQVQSPNSKSTMLYPPNCQGHPKMSVQNPRNFPIKKYSKLEIMLNPVEILYPEISNIARLCQHLWIFSSFMALYFAYVEISCFF